MKTLTTKQAEVLLAFMESFDLRVTGVWPSIEDEMINSFGIENPEDALEDAKDALR